MIRKQEEMIARYFERGMTSKEEQNFLISLAASDQMRIAFRSHLELAKAVRDDKDELRAVAQVRTRTFAALGLSAAAVSPFLEQELVNSSRAQAPLREAGAFNPGVVAKIGQFLRTRTFALGSGLLVGFSAAVGFLNISPNVESGHRIGYPSVIQRAAESAPQTAPRPSVAHETITPSKALDNVAAGAETVTGHSPAGIERARQAAAVHGVTIPSSHAQAHQPTVGQPEVLRSIPGTMAVHKPKITKPEDSSKAR